MSGSDSTYAATFGDGTSVLERVLLAIIHAHTTGETEGRQAERLQAAMTALIGPAMSDGQDMDKALLFIMRQRQKDICDFEMRTLRSCSGASVNAVRSVPDLAKLAAREVLGCTTAAEVKANARSLARCSASVELYMAWSRITCGRRWKLRLCERYSVSLPNGMFPAPAKISVSSDHIVSCRLLDAVARAVVGG